MIARLRDSCEIRYWSTTEVAGSAPSRVPPEACEFSGSGIGGSPSQVFEAPIARTRRPRLGNAQVPPSGHDPVLSRRVVRRLFPNHGSIIQPQPGHERAHALSQLNDPCPARESLASICVVPC